MYDWFPCPNYYPQSVLAEGTFGTYYSQLGIEQSNEGWHGLLFKLEDEEFVLADEQVFPSKYEAVQWAEGADIKLNAMYPSDDDDDEAGYWEAFLTEEAFFDAGE